MIPVQAQATAKASLPCVPLGACAPGTSLSVLPVPSAAPDIGDAIAQLMLMSSQASQQQLLIGKSQVSLAEDHRKAAAAERKAAIARAVEAERKAREEQSDGIFGFVTRHLGVTGLVGLVTFNAGLVATDLVDHMANPSQSSTSVADLAACVLGGPVGYVLERQAVSALPEDVAELARSLPSVKDEDVRVANKVALAVALAAVSAAVTVVTGGTTAPAMVALVGIGISTATQIATETGALRAVLGERAAGYVALGGALTGAALTLGGSIGSAFAATDAVKAASELKQAANVAQATTATIEGASTVTVGAAALRSAHHHYDADLANVDAEAQRTIMKRLERLINGVLEDLKAASESAQRATETLQGALQTNNQTLLLAGTMKA